ncbi:MAG: T9SS type A sorting domain-containing protein, partial [Bacteroidetes bacterium]|nr:T9SS type A sorting domain-containing protein [Bacteroidota bacterium]
LGYSLLDNFPDDFGSITVSAYSVLPISLNVQNVTIYSGQFKCYNANQNIIVAGSNTSFIIKNGGSTTMIAGNSIKYLSGTMVESGGYMWAYIAPTGPYCNTPLIPVSLTGNEKELPISGEQSSFVLFPNPTSSTFTLELASEPSSSSALVRIFNMMGEEVLGKQLIKSKKTEFSLENQSPGIYMVGVMMDGTMEMVKVIKYGK